MITETNGPMSSHVGGLLSELQSIGVRVETSMEGRRGGAGPADAGMVYVEGVPVTIPFTAEYATHSPYVLRQDGEEWAIFRDKERVASATLPPRPRYYDLTTSEGIPYWQIALLHLDSLASTVIQHCAYWGTDDQCRFCGIELTLQAGQTIPAKKPQQLAEVAAAAQRLDNVKDVTLTTGSTRGKDRGALYIGRCAHAIKEATGLPVQVQFEPPEDLSVLDEVKAMGVDTVGIHVESFDPEVLAWVAPPKARTGIERYFDAWERAVEIFGPGQVTTYVILGMGEDSGITLAGCRRAIDMGVYPFVVPLRPVPGSLMEDFVPPPAKYVTSMYRLIGPYLTSRGLAAAQVHAGCARCKACSALSLFETRNHGPGNRDYLPVL